MNGHDSLQDEKLQIHQSDHIVSCNHANDEEQAFSPVYLVTANRKIN